MGAIYASLHRIKEQLDDDPVGCRVDVVRYTWVCLSYMRRVRDGTPGVPRALPIGIASAKVGFAFAAGESGLSAARTASLLAMILCWSLFPCAALAQETEMRQPPTTQAERALAMIEQITNDFARLEALRAEPL
ncbi:MAG: hypothetical protein PVF93_09820, partial [Chromatiaceae bacterium]